jgi:hypothetical protein
VIRCRGYYESEVEMEMAGLKLETLVVAHEVSKQERSKAD